MSNIRFADTELDEKAKEKNINFTAAQIEAWSNTERNISEIRKFLIEKHQKYHFGAF